MKYSFFVERFKNCIEFEFPMEYFKRR